LADLLVIVPSRGRPGSIARMLDAVHATRRLDTHVHVCADDDDETLPQYEAVMARAAEDGDKITTGPRNGLCGWTNTIALDRAGEYRFLASFGDDMVPRTPGWDFLLTRGITDMGGTGITYPWDGTREDIPEAPVVSSDIVTALGWFFLPGVEHWFGDDALGEIGRRAGCIRHLRAVHVEHLHPGLGVTPFDKTNQDSSKTLAADRAVYREWRRTRMDEDIAAVARLRERALQPA
jgi:hypothetical protein